MDPYVKIIRAYNQNRGCSLTVYDIETLAVDPAIIDAAYNWTHCNGCGRSFSGEVKPRASDQRRRAFDGGGRRIRREFFCTACAADPGFEG